MTRLTSQSHAFSPRALLEQEDIILEYADMLMVAISEEAQKGPVNLTDCYNWATFDSMKIVQQSLKVLTRYLALGELAFGESFGSVKARKTNSWVATTLDMVRFIGYDSAVYRISPALERTLLKFIPAKINKGMMNHVTRSKAKILGRMNRKPERKDFCSYIFTIKEEMGLTDWEMAAYSNALIIAGSETTATVLSALTNWLGRTPVVYSKLKEEVRSRFNSSSEINSQTATFPYLTAVIHEILRLFPPVPNGLPRITPQGGEIVAGMFIPGGVSLCAFIF